VVKLDKRKQWLLHQDKIFDDLADKLNIKYFSKQKDILYDQHRTKVVRAARRQAKSFTFALTAYAVFYFGGLFDYDIAVKFAAPHNEDTRNLWTYFWKFWDKFPLCKHFDRYSEFSSNRSSFLNCKKILQFSETCFLQTATCENPDMTGLRGDGLDLVICDEFGQVQHRAPFLNAVSNSLKDENTLQMLIVGGTSQVRSLGPEFDDLFEKGQNPKFKNIKSWTLQYGDNPHMDADAAEAANELMDEDGYAIEVLGDSRPVGGRLFKDFDFSKCGSKVVPFNPDLPYGIGLDPGYAKPVAEFVQYDTDTGVMSVFKEVTATNVLITDLLAEIELEIASSINGIPPMLVAVDRAGISTSDRDKVNYTTFDRIKQVFRQAVFTHNPQLVLKSNQVFALRTLMKQDKLLIDKNCHRLLHGISNATPDVVPSTGAVKSGGWKKKRGVDDPLDALAYYMINFAPTSELVLPSTSVDGEDLLTLEQAQRISNLFL